MYVGENTAEFEISGVKVNELYHCGKCLHHGDG
jgi:hypothetical protein